MDIRTILKNLKIEELNAMQQAAVDAYKEGNDIVLLSPERHWHISFRLCRH